jgi:hypothetical protein
MSLTDLPVEEAEGIIAIPKFVASDDMSWSESPDHATHMVFGGPLYNENGTTIPGLTFEIAFRVPPRFDDCKYVFTVFSFRPNGRRRAYQLEVIPHEEVGHRDENGELFGPHEHVGQVAREVRVANLNCKHHEQWFREFLTRAHIKYAGRYFGPFDGGLFQ